MSDYWSERYGDLEVIAAETRGRCHLCLEPADLSAYGPTGSYGQDTVTIDHLKPQAFGGSDRSVNLRIAHGDCNSVRGIRRHKEVRFELTGNREAPLNAATFNMLSVGGSVAVGAAAGHAFATRNQFGVEEFNWGAALVSGLLTFAVTRAIY
ncbi:MAG: HNH endonuclease [Polyangiaceae bacterium]